MDSEGTLLKDPEGQTAGGLTSGNPAEGDTSRNKSHWSDWEIEQLVARLDAGEDIDLIVPDLHRSQSAVSQMLNSLMRGETKCPDAYQPALERLKKKAAAADSRKLKAPPLRGDSSQITEQYRNVTRLLCQVLEQVAETRHELAVAFAQALNDGSIKNSTLTVNFPALRVQKIRQIAMQINASVPADWKPEPGNPE